MHDLKLKKILCAIALSAFVGLFSGLACSQDTGGTSTADFLRFVQGGSEFEGELQTAIVTYRDHTGVELDLVAAVHMGEAAYYELLNDYFDSRDAVLYELIADENARPDGSGTNNADGLIGFIQTRLSEALALEFQLNTINYNRANFIHADLEPDELAQIMEAKGETLFSSILNMILAEMEYQQTAMRNGQPLPPTLSLNELLNILMSPNRQSALRYVLGSSLAWTGGNFYSTGLDTGITILDDRNQAALEEVSNALQNSSLRKLSLFYGAAHMPGLEAGIRDLGFSRVSQRWLTAWQSP